MKAAVLSGGKPVITTIETPSPKPNEILVRVEAASLNRADLHILAGASHGAIGGEGTVLGLECAGEIVQVGASVSDFRPGDRVMCSGSGAFAEYAATDWRRAFRIPSPSISYVEATCFPIAVRTMHDAIVTNGGLQPGHTILIQGASSAVGLIGLQISKILGASLVIGTSTNAERRDRLCSFGADVAIDPRQIDWVQSVSQRTDGQGVDILIDQLSGPFANQNMKAVRHGGTIVNVGRLADEQGNFDFNLHALRRIKYLGVTFRTRSIEQVHEISRRAEADLAPAIADRRLRLPVDRTYRLSEVSDALSAMDSNLHFGKIVLVP